MQFLEIPLRVLRKLKLFEVTFTLSCYCNNRKHRWNCTQHSCYDRCILIEVISKYLTDTVKYFPDEEVTSEPIEKRLTEIVREKVLELTDEEVPHSVHCVLSDITEDDKTINVYVDIIVDRDTLKKIIIGKKGLMLKEIGMKARKDMELLLKKQVYLELYVKTLKKWRDKEKYLNELGFNEY